MKTNLLSVLAVALLMLSQGVPDVWAIPQDFGAINAVGGGFGAGLENALRNRNNWAQGEKMPGEWKAVSGQPNQRQALPGAVFGVKADRAVMEVSDEKSAKSVVVTYTTKGAGLTEKQLWERLKANVTTFTTTSADKSKPAVKVPTGKADVNRFEGAGLVVELKKTADAVEAHLSPSEMTASKAEAKPVTAAKPK